MWVLTTLIAAAAQTGRNAAQAGLTRVIGTAAATQVRFVFGLPFGFLFLAAIWAATGEAPPVPGLRSLLFTGMGALAQVLATALMLLVMRRESFAVTTAWLKTEPVLVALGAALILREVPGPAAWGAIALATLGVGILALKPGVNPLASLPAMALGLVAAGLFGASAIGFRGGILALPGGSDLIRAAVNLCLSLGLQTLMLALWMGLFDRKALAAPFRHWRQSLGAGFLGAFASLFWFVSFALASAAHVRTLALVDVLYAQLLARWQKGERATPRQWLGMALIVLGVGALLRLG